MKKAIYRLANFVFLVLKIWNPVMAFHLSKFKSQPDFGTTFKVKGDGLFFPTQKLLLSKYILQTWRYNLLEICRLSKNRYLTSVEQIGSDLVISLQYKSLPLRLSCNSLDSLMVVNELFTDEIYEFDYNHNMICIDIGMNVGYSALLLASRPDVEKVYGYEPFAGTYQKALQNFALNPQLTEKIVPINTGWSDKTGPFSFRNYADGSIGASTSFTADFNVYGQTTDVTTVQLVDASAALREIRTLHPGKSFFLKMDCEGSEYEIFEKLDQDDMLQYFDAVLLEWHYKGPEPINSILKKNGFSYYSTGRPDAPDIGFVYAFKRRKDA